MVRIATAVVVGLLVVVASAVAQPDCFDYGDLTRQIHACTLPLHSDEIVVAGDVAYTTGTPETYLGVISLGPDSEPTVVAEIHPPWIAHLAVDGDLMLGGAHGDVYLLDRSDPLAPVVQGQLSSPQGMEVRAVAMAGETGLVLVDPGGVGAHVGVYDLDPFQQAGALDLPIDVSDVVMHGTWAYASSIVGSTILVLDLADPAAPEVASTLEPLDPEATRILDLELGDGRLFVTMRVGASASRLASFDLADPAAPALQAAHDLDFAAREAAWNGEELVIRGDVDVTSSSVLAGVAWFDPAVATDTWRIRGLDNGTSIALHENKVLTVGSKLRVYAPGSPVEPEVTVVEAWYDLRGLATLDDHVWVADTYYNHSRIHVLDAASGTFVAERSIANLGSFLSPAPDGQLMLADVGSAPWLFDATDPLNPQQIAPLPIDDFAHGAWGAERTVYVTTEHPGEPQLDPELVRIDVSNPAAPLLEGLLVIDTWELTCLAARDGWAYVGTPSGTVNVVDFQDPADPAVAAEITLPGNSPRATDLLLVGDRLVVGVSGSSELLVYDVSLPSSPVLVFRENLPAPGTPSLHRDGDMLYVSNILGFHGYDLSADLPDFIGWYGATDRIESLVAAGGRIVTVRGNERLTMVPVQCAEVGAVEDLPAAMGTLRAWPNPFNPRVELAGVVPAAGRVRLTIHDLAGRRVATLADEHRQAGPASWTWHGADDAGRSLPSGVYLARLVTATGARGTKLVLVR